MLLVFLYDFEERVLLFPLSVSYAASVLKKEFLVCAKALGPSLQLYEIGSNHRFSLYAVCSFAILSSAGDWSGFTHTRQVLCRRATSLSLYCLTFIFKWGLTKVLRQALNSSSSIFSLLSSWNYRIATPSQAHLLFKATGLPQYLASLWGACTFMMFGAHYASLI